MLMNTIVEQRQSLEQQKAAIFTMKAELSFYQENLQALQDNLNQIRDNLEIINSSDPVEGKTGQNPSEVIIAIDRKIQELIGN